MSASGSARDEVLMRLRAVSGGVRFRGGGDEEPPHPPSSVAVAEGSAESLARRFGEELERVLGSYEIVAPEELAPRVVAHLVDWIGCGKGASEAKVLSWGRDELPVTGLSEELAASGIALLVPEDLNDETQRQAAARAVVGLTSVEAAFAGTGSVLVTPAAGRSRAASLLPTRHLVLVPFSRIHPSVEAWLSQLRREDRTTALLRQSRQWAFITGPSKSADIELNLTVGVHGPGVVHAILFNDTAG